MMSLLNGDGGQPSTLFQRVTQSIKGTANPSGAGAQPDEVLPKSERKAAMSSLGEVEVKWAKAGLVLDSLLSAFLTYYLAVDHPTKKVSYKHDGKTAYHYVPLTTSWLLLGGILLVCCAVGFLALRRRKRTLVAFSFFISGFAFTLIFAPLGFALILLGGWLMMRAYRIQKYGTASAKMIAQGRAQRAPRQRKSAAKASTAPVVRKPPTASKRYTPKAPPRKKIPKEVSE